MSTNIDVNLLLEFRVAFPNEEPKQINEYLEGGGRDIIIQVATYFLGFKVNNSRFNDTKTLLGNIFSEKNNLFANDLFDRIAAFERRTEKRVIIINHASSLRLFEEFFLSESLTITQSKEEFERNILRAYLVLNSRLISDQEMATESTKELDSYLNFPMKFFCVQYPIFDVTNYNLRHCWVTEVTKAILLFKYLETNGQTKILLQKFLEHFDKKDWREYLRFFLPLVDPVLKKVNEAHTDIRIPKDESFNQVCDFVDKLILDKPDNLIEFDFITLRSSPYYKIEPGLYRIIFDLFVVEKVFKGLYFLLASVNDNLIEGQKIKNWRSIYGKNFSEKILLYQVVEKIYPKPSCRISGEEFEKKRIDGAPDYYIRNGRKVVLFECKDFLIPKDVKTSHDFFQYEDAFEKALYFTNDGKEKPKAVLQLIRCIEKMLLGKFKFEDGVSYQDCSIYPVIILNDRQYNSPGFNVLIDNWFQFELEALRSRGLPVNRVNPLVIICIDTLILHESAFRKRMRLEVALDSFYSKFRTPADRKFDSLEELEDAWYNHITPFSVHVDVLFERKGFRGIPSILNDNIPELFNNEFANTNKG